MKEMNLKEIGSRIKEMREITGLSSEYLAEKAGISIAEFAKLEAGEYDPPFTVLHRCAVALKVDVTSLVEGHSTKLSGHIITRKGEGLTVTDEQGIRLQNMAAMFKNRLATPYYVTYQYDAAAQDKPIHLTTHAGQEFDLVLEGSIKLQIGDHVEILNEGDSAFYQSSNPHGMLAIGGKPAKFLAMIMAEDEKDTKLGLEVEYGGKNSSNDRLIDLSNASESTNRRIDESTNVSLLASRFIAAEEAPGGKLKHIKFGDLSSFNFAYDIIDEIAAKYPEKLAMLHVANDFTEKRISFDDLRRESNKVANYLTSLGIGRGDKVMLVLKRHWQFWPIILGIHKVGAVVIPATSQLVTHDFTYRFKAADVKAAFITADGEVTKYADEALSELSSDISTGDFIKVVVNSGRAARPLAAGWRDFDEEIKGFSDTWSWAASPAGQRGEKRPGGSDPMLMFFTSGTTGYPKMALHSYKYPCGHYVTAKYWHQVKRDGLHFTISETGWAKAMWGKMYGQWLCEAAIFVYDFDRFHAEQVLPMFAKYKITTFCAPPTMYRMLIKEDISKYDFSSVEHTTTAGEALNPEVFLQFKKSTGLEIFEGFGQTETTCALGNLFGDKLKPGSMGKPIPDYDIDLVDEDGNSVAPGEHGEIVVRTPLADPHPGIFIGYYKDDEKTAEAWRHGMYHTCDLAWKDEDDYYHYVGRADDVIKSSGYRIGPFEIENVIMELPYVVECGVSAAPDPVRGQIVKATIKLVKVRKAPKNSRRKSRIT